MITVLIILTIFASITTYRTYENMQFDRFSLFDAPTIVDFFGALIAHLLVLGGILYILFLIKENCP